MRINGWQRIGIVLSITWIIGAAYVSRQQEMKTAENILNFQFNDCWQSKEYDFKTCSDKRGETWLILMKPHWSNHAFYSLTPAVLGWLFVYMMLGIYRWVRRGFTNPRKP